MMKKNWFCASIILLSLLAAAPAYCTSGNVNFFIGQKSMDDSDFWKPVDDHTEFGVNFDMIEKGWPVSLDLGLMMSSDESSDNYGSIEGKTNELYVGIKKIWVIRNFPLKPFVSGGLSYVSAEMEGENYYGYFDDDDSAMGFYLSAGAYATLSKHLNLGLLFRISKAEVELFGDDVDAGGEHFGLFLGYHF
jgi:opacity protein-like surface antigen